MSEPFTDEQLAEMERVATSAREAIANLETRWEWDYLRALSPKKALTLIQEVRRLREESESRYKASAEFQRVADDWHEANRQKQARIRQLEIGHDAWRTEAHRAKERAEKAEAMLAESIALNERQDANWQLRVKQEMRRRHKAEAEVERLRKHGGWRECSEAMLKLEAERDRYKKALEDIASWDTADGHDGNHRGPCQACQRVFTVDTALQHQPVREEGEKE